MHDAWGAVRSADDWTSPPKSMETSVALDYTGHDERLGSDLVNLGARYFDTRLGRAISADTVVPNPLDSQSFNRFAYVQNNPLSYTDPTGHAPEEPDADPGPALPPDPSQNSGDLDDGYTGDKCGIQCRVIHVTTVESTADEVRDTYGTGFSANQFEASTPWFGRIGNAAKGLQNSRFPPAFRALGNLIAQIPTTDQYGRNLSNIAKYGLLSPYVPPAPGSQPGIDCTGMCATISGSLVDRQGVTDALEITRVGAEVLSGTNNSPGVVSAEITELILIEAVAGAALTEVLEARAAAKVAPKLCFAAGTLVETADGPKAIEKVEVGDLVWSRDDETGEEDWKPVTEVFVTPNRELLELTFESGDGTTLILRVTSEHPLWSLDDGAWDEAGHLDLGEQVDALHGPIWLANVVALPGTETVYNFEVKDSHTYFVGESGAWVHNNCGLEDLAQFRAELGLAEGEGTLARLDIGGESFYGINAHGTNVSMRINAISRTHAEADAFQQALNAGAKSSTARMFVDRGLCLACGRNGGVRSMMQALGVQSLEVYTPGGSQVIISL